MTRMLDSHDLATLVAREGLPALLHAMSEAIRTDFLRWPEFDKSARHASHSAVGVIELMPVSCARQYSFKYVNGHPKNFERGLPTVMAFGVLADVDTGYPRLLSELTLTTAIRTAATSALAASVLARPQARSMALIGNGAQAEFQVLAFHELLGIDEFRLFDIDPVATDKLLRNLGRHPRLKLRPCGSTREAVRGADIVTTVTADKTNAVILDASMLEPGMHVNAVGGDCPGKTELAAGVLQAASVFVEYEPQTRIEGDLQQMPPEFPVTELWQVLAGHQPGRRSAAEITVFDSVGFALEDYSALRLLDQRARALNLGREIALIPALDDPRDLYGQLLGSSEARRAA